MVLNHGNAIMTLNWFWQPDACAKVEKGSPGNTYQCSEFLSGVYVNS